MAGSYVSKMDSRTDDPPERSEQARWPTMAIRVLATAVREYGVDSNDHRNLDDHCSES